MTFRAFSIGFSAAVLALACGGDDNGGNDGNGATPTPVTPPVDVTPAIPQVETCEQNPLLAQCLPAAPAPAAGAPTPPRGGLGDGEDELAKAAAENILNSNCGQCHGPGGPALAGMNYINDIDQLVTTGKIVPLNSAGSRVIQRMERGEMPPVNSGLPAVTQNDIDTVAQYIDNPRFWPDVAPTSGNCTDDGQVVDFDTLFQEVNDDLNSADNDDVVFFRYVSLTNRFTAGQCSDALDRDRQGLVKMLNMLSIDPTITEPEPIDQDETIYRIDLRDYQWDRAISVNGVAFDDVWEAIADANPYAVEFEGDDADDTKDDTQTAFPIQFADQMMDVAVIGNLYYAIVDVDVNDTLGNFVLNDLLVNVDQNILDEEDGTIRAGTTRSRISRQDRVVERHDLGVRAGALWQSFDFEDVGNNENIFEDPFGFIAGGTEAIFTLPNGLLAYVIADANDAIVEDSDILLDTNQNNFRAVTSVSCSNCHSAGLIPVVDEVREIALSNQREIGLDRDEVEQLESIYVTAPEFARVIQEDSQSFYQRALQQASLPIQGGDPVSGTFLRFDQDLRIEDAAGDLGLTADELDESLDLLDPTLAVLERGTLDRDDFTNVYIDSLCILSEVLENQPLAADCDAAAALLQ
ncbi:MAG: Serine/threonine-protein kinase pkn1 [Pseudomonadota bacterium]